MRDIPPNIYRGKQALQVGDAVAKRREMLEQELPSKAR